ncbi:patatin-like phospholipase/acyl hydrolase [Bradyrhizobium sp. F1.13.1]
MDQFLILSLSGGGYCGLYTAEVLRQLQSERGESPLLDGVDLICGTSIGGMIALALAHEIPIVDICNVLENDGRRLFGCTGSLLGQRAKGILRSMRSLVYAQYSSASLKTMTEALLGERLINEAKRPVAVTAVSLTSGRSCVFSNFPRRGLQKALRSADLALATSAAPTYFAPHRIENEYYVDGGLVANAPDMLALSLAVANGYSLDNIVMISIGAINRNTSNAVRKSRFPGLVSHALSARSYLAFVFEAQQNLAVESAERVVSSRNYFRVSEIPSDEQSKHLGLDRAGVVAADTLKALAKRSSTDEAFIGSFPIG